MLKNESKAVVDTMPLVVIVNDVRPLEEIKIYKLAETSVTLFKQVHFQLQECLVSEMYKIKLISLQMSKIEGKTDDDLGGH